MKKLFVILFLLIPLYCYAGTDTLEGEELTTSATIEGVSTTDTVEGQEIASAGGFIHENGFEAQSDDDDWTADAGSPDLDYSTAGLSLEGSECAELSPSEAITIDVTTTGEIYTVWMFRLDDDYESTETPFRIRDSGDSTLASVVFQNGNSVKAQPAGGSYTSSVATISSATSYYIKLRYKPGTGANAEIECWISTDGTTWGTPQSSNDGTATANADNIRMYNGGDTEVLYIDRFIENSSDITDASF